MRSHQYAWNALAASSPLNGAQFKYETRIKDKPNSQGTLFSANPDQRRPESRQPRGYSSQRYKDVGQALGLLSLHGKVVDPSGLNDGAMSHAIQTVARSTVPLKDLEDPDSDYVAMHITDQPGIGGVEEGAEGDYWQGGEERGAHIGVRPRAVKGTTPIHEIGHHADPDIASYGSAADKGHAEGYADKYADEHARTGGYKQKQMRPDTRWDRPYDWRNKQDPVQFAVSYNTERYGDPRRYGNPPLQPDQFDGLPKNHVKGQLPLLHRAQDAAWSGEKPKNVRWDYADVDYSGTLGRRVPKSDGTYG